MWRLLLGLGLVHAVAVVVGLATFESTWITSVRPHEVAYGVFVVPMAVAWSALELIAFRRPRHLFLGRRRGSFRLVALGAISATTATVLAGIAVGWLHPWVDDVVLIGLIELIIVTMAVLTIPRARSGHCLYCGFDVRARGLGELCAECGAAAPMG